MSGLVLRRIELTMGPVDTLAGRPARRIDGTFQTALPRPGRRRAFSIWFSQEGDLPLRIAVDFQFGQLIVVLTSHAR
jgi:hypothetical protein